MAPTSRMLVYYVKDDGEGIADSINLLVEPELENEVMKIARTKSSVFTFIRVLSVLQAGYIFEAHVLRSCTTSDFALFYTGSNILLSRFFCVKFHQKAAFYFEPA